MRLIGMKESPKREEVHYYLELENEQELQLYFEKFEGEFATFFKSLLRSDYSVSKWDHVSVKGTPASLFYAAVLKMKTTDTSPYQALTDMSVIKRNVFEESLSRYGSLCVDLSMGTCRPPFDETEIVVSNEEIDVISLENDTYENL